MPQLQLPICPSGSKKISKGIAVECRDKQVVYFSGLLPVFQHAEGDLQSFRLFTSQLIDMGAGTAGGHREYLWGSAAHCETISKTIKTSWPEKSVLRTQAAIGTGADGRCTANRRAFDRGRHECARGGGGQRRKSQYPA